VEDLTAIGTWLGALESYVPRSEERLSLPSPLPPPSERAPRVVAVVCPATRLAPELVDVTRRAVELLESLDLSAASTPLHAWMIAAKRPFCRDFSEVVTVGWVQT